MSSSDTDVSHAACDAISVSAQAIPEGDWSCPHCAPAQDAAPRKETLLNAAVRAAEDPLDSAAAAESGGSLASPSTLAVMSDDALAQRDDAEAADASASSAKWSRPTREEGIGGGWMVGRRVQVWCDSRQAWREGSVQGVDFNDDRVHSVLFVDSGDEQTEFVNLSKLRWCGSPLPRLCLFGRGYFVWWFCSC